MEEIFASIRRIIADDQALSASQGGPPNGAALTPASRTGAGRTLVSNGQGSSVRAAFNTLLASRFVQQSDVIIGLNREMLRPMLKTWSAIVERLVAVEIERVARGE